MITFSLDQANEQRLAALAKLQGRDVSQLAVHIIEAYLDAQAWARDSEAAWAEASTALTAEVFEEEDWSAGD